MSQRLPLKTRGALQLPGSLLAKRLNCILQKSRATLKGRLTSRDSGEKEGLATDSIGSNAHRQLTESVLIVVSGTCQSTEVLILIDSRLSLLRCSVALDSQNEIPLGRP